MERSERKEARAQDPSLSEQVVLVDRQDRPIGTEEKLAAHRRGVLHRAFSVFVFNDEGELLLQRRAPGKYHSGGLWSNTCCSHPRPGEPTDRAARRRLGEEMGIDCDLEHLFSFSYRAAFPDGLIEHEYDHVFVGYSDEVPRCDPGEVMDYRWTSLPALRADMDEDPASFTVWFRMALNDFYDVLSSAAEAR